MSLETTACIHTNPQLQNSFEKSILPTFLIPSGNFNQFGLFIVRSICSVMLCPVMATLSLTSFASFSHRNYFLQSREGLQQMSTHQDVVQNGFLPGWNHFSGDSKATDVRILSLTRCAALVLSHRHQVYVSVAPSAVGRTTA